MKYVGFDSRIEWHSPEIAALVAADVLPVGRVLDIGCGHGTEGLFLAYMGWRVLGIDEDAKAIRGANMRRKNLPPTAQERVQFIRGDAFSFRDARPGKFQVVIDRLVYSNQFSERSDGVPGEEDRAVRHRLIKTAAHALEPGRGVFLMRFTAGLQDEWGNSPHRSLADDDLELVERYFQRGREIGYLGLVTDPIQQVGALVITVRPMSILVLRRKRIRFVNR